MGQSPETKVAQFLGNLAEFSKQNGIPRKSDSDTGRGYGGCLPHIHFLNGRGDYA